MEVLCPGGDLFEYLVFRGEALQFDVLKLYLYQVVKRRELGVPPEGIVKQLAITQELDAVGLALWNGLRSVRGSLSELRLHALLSSLCAQSETLGRSAIRLMTLWATSATAYLYLVIIDLL